MLPPEEVQKLSDEERKRLEGEVEKLQGELQKILRQLPRLQRQMQDRVQELNREIANFAVSGSLDDLREKHKEIPVVVDYLHAVQKDVIENVRDFFLKDDDAAPAQANGAGDTAPPLLPATRRSIDLPTLRRYRVNVLVDHSQTHGAPVIYENNPTYQNLMGRLEYVAQMGAFTTDFNLLKAGALHRANGGYLLLDARDLLLQPFAWEGLKRAFRACQLQIESPNQVWGGLSTVTLEPEPIPLDVKIALVGEPQLYYMIAANDPEFGQLFKVTADFADQMEPHTRNPTVVWRLIAHLARKNNLRPFDRTGVARHRTERPYGRRRQQTFHACAKHCRLTP